VVDTPDQPWTPDRKEAELESFRDLWHGGFFVADPAEKLAPFWLESMVGGYHVIYLACIRPWLTPQTHALEIGCGRGAWTRLLLKAEQITCVDALSAEHNAFYSYVGKVDNVFYHQVEDFTLSMIPDNTIDYVFSYDALCHVSFSGISEYAQSLYRVMKKGGHGFLMVADYRKFNEFVDLKGSQNALHALLPKRHYPMVRRVGSRLIRRYSAMDAHRRGIHVLNLNEDDAPRPGRWYHAGAAETSHLLFDIGFTVLDEDMGVDPRSPVIHFRR
jgi:SAM-dependent methyltransferase